MLEEPIRGATRRSAASQAFWRSAVTACSMCLSITRGGLSGVVSCRWVNPRKATRTMNDAGVTWC